jgi:hypothetical protein
VGPNQLVILSTLADQVEAAVADTDPPAWVTQCSSVLPSSVVGEVSVWRAAMQVSLEDRRPTGPVQLQKAARSWQVHLDRQVAGDRVLALEEWGWLIDQPSPNLTRNPFAPMLANRLAAIFPRRRRRAAAVRFGHHRRWAAAR